MPHPTDIAKKLLDWPLSRLVLTFVVYIGMVAVFGALLRPFNLPGGYVEASVVQAFAIFGALAFVNLYLRAQPLAESPLRLRKAGAHLVVGTVIGMALMGVVVGILALFGWYQVTGVQGSGVMAALGMALVVTLINAAFQEAFDRGMVFTTLEEALGSYAAIALDVVIFGLLHLTNPGTSVLEALVVGVEFGILAGAAYMLTRSLWLPIGLHFGWNFMQGGILGLPVSGTPQRESLLIGGTLGPEALTGGSFGPEAGIVAIVVGTTAGLLMLWAAIRAGQVRTPYWMRRMLDLPEDTSHIRRRLK